MLNVSSALWLYWSNRYIILTLMAGKKRVYNRIKVVMVEKRISREEMAAHLGKDERQVTRYMTNEVQPPIPVLYQIAERCKVEVRELLVSSMEPPIFIGD
jgi:putative transcriptional regulator